MKEEERIARFKLAHVTGVGPSTFQALLTEFGSIEYIFNLSDSLLRKELGNKLGERLGNFRNDFDTIKELGYLVKKDINYVVFGEDRYPEILASTSSAPICIYYRGNYSDSDFLKSIAIVGSRKMSGYGKSVIEKLAGGFVDRGFVVVSGMAFGIDRESHIQTISSGGKTVAVLASDAATASPSRNRDVYDSILNNNGVIISETHIGEQIHSKFFPRRNRLIAGLSLGTIVVEAAQKSGALITANIAFSEGRHVFAVPGNIGQQMSKGTNDLIKNSKAKLVENVDDVMIEFGYLLNKEGNQGLIYEPKSDIESKLIDTLRLENMNMDMLKNKVPFQVSELLGALSMLEIEGVVQKEEGGVFRLVI